MGQRIVLLNGLGQADRDLDFCLDILVEEVEKTGAEVQLYTPRNMQTGTCIGCFGCWLKTPGICIEPDEGRDAAQAVLHSDMTILISPVVFGGYSSEIKKLQDRWIPLVLPYFGFYHGEIHHRPRYAHYPRLVGIGIQRQPNAAEAQVFKTLVGRNALNFHAPSYGAEVVVSTDDPDQLRQQFRSVLTRRDPIASSTVMKSVMQALEHDQAIATNQKTPAAAAAVQPGRALLLVGSPKVKSPSTSAVLGGYILDHLQRQGWQGECLTLRREIFRAEKQAAWLAAVDQADLLILAFPLYIDALPMLVTRALEVMANHFATHPRRCPKALVAVCNNGFPESYQNAIALSICRWFALETGLHWQGGLALGAGEAMVGGQPITGANRSGRPPIPHIIQALDLASEALAQGQPIPVEVNSLMAQVPIPFMPLNLWRLLFIPMAGNHWRREAALRQTVPADLYAQPYRGLG